MVFLKILQGIARKYGFQVNRIKPRSMVSQMVPTGLSKRDYELIDSIQPYTLTSRERLYALIESVRYVGV